MQWQAVTPLAGLDADSIPTHAVAIDAVNVVTSAQVCVALIEYSLF